MANGNISYNDTKKAWLIEDVFDFIAIGSYTNPSAVSIPKCILTKDIDFNDHPIYKYGINTARLIDKETIIFDGQGHEIRNMIFKQANTVNIRFKSIENTNFVNLIYLDCSYGNPNSAGASAIIQSDFTNCNFSIFSAGSDSACIWNLGNNNDNQTNYIGYSHIVNCSYNIKGSFDASINMLANFEYCHLNFDVTLTDPILHAANSSEGTQIFFKTNGNTKSCYLTNTYITGEIRCTKIGDDNFTYLFYGKPFKLSNMYLSAKLPDIYAFYGLYFIKEGIITSCSFVDKSIQNTGKDLNSVENLFILDPTQCKDAEYLSSIGFPVVKIEETTPTPEPTPTPTPESETTPETPSEG